MSGETRRCFLGVALPESVRNALAAWCAANRSPALKGSWARPQNYHITLRFLGGLDEAQLDALDTGLGAAFSACGPVRLRLTGVSAFPTLRKPRVLWAGVEILDGDMEPLFEAAESAARAIGLAPELRPGIPHVTLLRLRIPPSAGLPRPLLESGQTFTTDEFEARSVALWESILGPGGATYVQRKEYPLT